MLTGRGVTGSALLGGIQRGDPGEQGMLGRVAQVMTHLAGQ